jgi:primosomal protein N' (replication factor Y)
MPPSKARARVQARCLELLREAGGVLPMRELAAAVAGGRAALRRLAEKGVLDLSLEEWEGRETAPLLRIPEIALNLAQAAAVERIEASIHAGDAATFLLHGVTGSGKTEVYLRAIRAAHRAGKQTIFLVPEITLTPQTVSRLRGRFGGRAAVIHSRLTDGERRRLWSGAKRGDYDVVLGPRSAIFAPVPNLGLIVVDEEHDGATNKRMRLATSLAMSPSSAPGGRVRWSCWGRQLPMWRRSYARKRENSISCGLPDRVSNLPMPPVRIVDLRSAAGHFTPSSWRPSRSASPARSKRFSS